MTQDTAENFKVKLYGTRGTLACPGEQFSRAGGNTPCTLVTCGKRQIIIDAGSGFKILGEEMVEEWQHAAVDLLISHGHYDHIEGLPFFLPFYEPNFSMNIFAGKLDGAPKPQKIFEELMQPPCFPVGMEIFDAQLEFSTIGKNKSIDLGDGIVVKTAPLNHPGGATGFRIEYEGKSFAYVCDTEHIPGETDQNVMKLISQADLFIYDATFTKDEFPSFIGYGHSTWEEAIRLAKQAEAKSVLASHHSLFRTDDELDAVEKQMQKNFSGIAAARDGMVIEL